MSYFKKYNKIKIIGNTYNSSLIKIELAAKKSENK